MLKNINNINEIKQKYRELTMLHYNEPNTIDDLNKEYENLINKFENNDNSFMFHDNSSNGYNIFDIINKTQKNDHFNKTSQLLNNPNLMFMTMNPQEEQELMNHMMNSLPDMLNVAFDMKKRYDHKQNKKDKTQNLFSNFVDFMNIYSDDESHLNNNIKSNIEINEIINKEDIKIIKEVSILQIYNCETINISYNINYNNNDVNEKKSVLKTIELDSLINHNAERIYKNDGNVYLQSNNEKIYSDLIIVFKIKENINYENNFNILDNESIFYEKDELNYNIHLILNFKESLLGFSKIIKLPNSCETKINIFTQGKVIMNNDKKELQNKGFNDKINDNIGNIKLFFYIQPLTINNIKEKEHLINDLLS